ncbi:MAG TPA: PhzF family phenazine biosynthesis protein [Aestuariivirgaceae bacterium]|nr:PhzF family phenazine biosynthesis protein [Aestuariivirgaceae bacterium]
MKLKFHTLDVFTRTPFTGNPLAVVLDADSVPDDLMQRIAREFNLSETVFVQTPADPANTAKVRIFTPSGELPFAGHPTVGCAVLLASLKHKDNCSFETQVKLEAKAGLVPVKVSRIGPDAHAVFTAPKLPRNVGPPPAAERLARAVGLDVGEIGFGTHVPGLYMTSSRVLFVPVASLDALARTRVIEPAWSAALAEAESFNVYLYAAGGADPGTSYRARLYAPGEGIPEDPATGLAAATFPGQLVVHEKPEDGTARWRVEQGYEMGRPSQIDIEADIREGRIVAVRVGGSAVRIGEGILQV